MIYDDRSLADVDSSPEDRHNSTAIGQLAYSIDFEGNIAAHTYDNTPAGSGQMQTRAYYDADDLVGVTIDASTTAADLRTILSGIDPQRTVAYEYDALGREVKVTIDRNPAGPADLHDTETSYDDLGRVTQITSPEGAINYEYDEATGDQTAVETANTRTEYLYDVLGRLIEVKLIKREATVLPTPEAATYAYDLMGNLDLTQHDVNELATNYSYDKLNRAARVLHFIDANANNLMDLGETLIADFQYEYQADGN